MNFPRVAILLIMAGWILHAQVWTKSFSLQTAANTVSDLACTENGQLCMAGYFTDSLVFFDTSLVSHGQTDCFIAFIDSLNRRTRLTTFGREGSDYIYAIDLQKNGVLTATGTFQNTLSVGDQEFPAPAYESFFIATFTPEGRLRNAIVTDAFCGKAVTSNKTGLVAVAGQFIDSTIAPSGDTLHGRGENDIFCTLLDASGIPRWSVGIGGRTNDYVNRLVFSENDHLFLLGTMADTLFFGNDTLPAAGGTELLFIAEYDTLGNLLMKRKIESSTGVYSSGIMCDAQENIYLTGSFKGDITIDTVTVEGYDEYDFFLAKLTPSMKVQWIIHADLAFGNNIVAGPDSTLFVSGSFRRHSTIGEYYLEAHDIEDIFIGSFATDGDCREVLTAGGCRSSNARRMAANDHNLFITGDVNKSGCIHDCTIDFGSVKEVFLVDTLSEGSTYLATIDYTIDPQAVRRPLPISPHFSSLRSPYYKSFDLKGRQLVKKDQAAVRGGSASKKHRIASQVIVTGAPHSTAENNRKNIDVR